MEVFGSKFDPKQPLYVNLFILREIHNYLEARNREAMRYSVPGTLVFNFFWYYYNRSVHKGKTMIFASVPRTLILFSTFSFLYYSIFSQDKMARSYKININNLLNIDEPFLYDNVHFRGLIRRLYFLHPSLLN